MDPTSERAVNTVIADLANDGGGTYQQGTYLPFKPESGFAVALPDGLKLPAAITTASMVAWAMRQVSRENPLTSFIGTWLHDGVVYIDAVQYFGAERREAAIKAGREAGQQAIYDFATKQAIVL